jgi:acetyl esterase/lipase
MKTAPLLALIPLAAAQGRYGSYPPGWVDFNGGDTGQQGKAMQKMMGNLKPPAEILRSGGSGRYKARVIEDSSLPGHTIFAPASPPAGMKLPVVLWGNGGCLAMGQVHGGVLTDIASHGYVVVANGGKNPAAVSFSKNTDMFDAALWAAKQGAKYGADATRVASAGQSCGGMQA